MKHQNYNQDKPVYAPSFFSIDFWQDFSQLKPNHLMNIDSNTAAQNYKSKNSETSPLLATRNDEASWASGA